MLPVMPMFHGSIVSKGPVLVAILTNKTSVASEIVRIIGKMRIGGGGIARVSCVGAEECSMYGDFADISIRLPWLTNNTYSFDCFIFIIDYVESQHTKRQTKTKAFCFMLCETAAKLTATLTTP